MIHYTLRCDRGHSFDSWFKSSDAFDALVAAGHVTCALCGSDDVSKAMMAPRVCTARKTAPHAAEGSRPQAKKQSMAMTADPELARAIAELRERVEQESDYVGDAFAREARSMYLGDVPTRSIYGEATADEARGLLEDGVPVLPLPFMPTRKAN